MSDVELTSLLHAARYCRRLVSPRLAVVSAGEAGLPELPLPSAAGPADRRRDHRLLVHVSRHLGVLVVARATTPTTSGRRDRRRLVDARRPAATAARRDGRAAAAAVWCSLSLSLSLALSRRPGGRCITRRRRRGRRRSAPSQVHGQPGRRPPDDRRDQGRVAPFIFMFLLLRVCSQWMAPRFTQWRHPA